MIQLMVEGDKWEMYIPSDLAYGDHGSPPKIPGKSVLIFQMEIVEIKGDKVPALKCDASSKDNCNEKETAYIDKISSWAEEKIKTEVGRLEKIWKDKDNLKSDLQNWVNRRLFILRQKVKGDVKDDEEL